MKKMNVLMGAAVAGLFAVSANAADAKKADHAAPKTEKECTEHKMTWKDGKCTCAASTEAAPAPAAPAKK